MERISDIWTVSYYQLFYAVTPKPSFIPVDDWRFWYGFWDNAFLEHLGWHTGGSYVLCKLCIWLIQHFTLQRCYMQVYIKMVRAFRCLVSSLLYLQYIEFHILTRHLTNCLLGYKDSDFKCIIIKLFMGGYSLWKCSRQYHATTLTTSQHRFR